MPFTADKRVVDGVEADCPGCGKRIRLGFDQDGEALGEHPEPTCTFWVNTELDEITATVRKIAQKGN